MAHHVSVKGWVGRVWPCHGETLSFVLHSAVLEPNLENKLGVILGIGNIYLTYNPAVDFFIVVGINGGITLFSIFHSIR